MSQNVRLKGALPINHCWCQKLEWLPFRLVSKYPWCIVWFCHTVSLHVWQTDGRTDRQNYDSWYGARIGVRAVKIFLRLWRDMHIVSAIWAVQYKCVVLRCRSVRTKFFRSSLMITFHLGLVLHAFCRNYIFIQQSERNEIPVLTYSPQLKCKRKQDWLSFPIEGGPLVSAVIRDLLAPVSLILTQRVCISRSSGQGQGSRE